MKRASFLAATAAIALFGFAAPANATHTENGLGCGDSLEMENETVTLTGDVQCGDASTDTFGLIPTANGVTLNLNGFAIRGGAGAAANDSSLGIFTSFVRGFTVKGGRIEGFANGIELNAIEVRVEYLTIVARKTGIHLYGAHVEDPGAGSHCEPRFPEGRSCIFRNSITITGPGAQDGILVRDTDDGHIWGNTVRSTVPMSAYGIATDSITAGLGDRPRIVKNTVLCAGGPGDGIRADSYSTFAIISQNTVGDLDATFPTSGQCFNGINVNGGGARVHRNLADGNAGGINVNDPSARIWRNRANGNVSSSGIFVHQSGNVVQENTANSNAFHGIVAPLGTIDGGGNRASGNHTNTPGSTEPQCVNVACAP
jgi:hypothetical protein